MGCVNLLREQENIQPPMYTEAVGPVCPSDPLTAILLDQVREKLKSSPSLPPSKYQERKEAAPDLKVILVWGVIS